MAQMARWRMSIKTIIGNWGAHPVFKWVYNPPFCNGGEVFTNISEDLLIVKKYNVSKGQPGKWGFSSVEGAVSKINECGWPRPPHINEVFRAMEAFREKFPGNPLAKKDLIELQEKWEAIIGEDEAPRPSITASPASGLLGFPYRKEKFR